MVTSQKFVQETPNKITLGSIFLDLLLNKPFIFFL